ncbi:MAG: DinB family protein, partial [Phycisphaerae bacterium]
MSLNVKYSCTHETYDPMTNAELLARNLEGTRDWTQKLLADLQDDDWFFQPAPGMGHALWLCGHLAVAQDLLV